MIARDRAKIDFFSEYHFTSALENTVFPSYITEKRWHSWYSRSVPIIWGGISDRSKWEQAQDDPDAYRAALNDPENWSRKSTPGENSAIFVEDWMWNWYTLGRHLIDMARNRTAYLQSVPRPRSVVPP